MKKSKTAYQIFLSLITISILFVLSSCNLITLNKTEPEKRFFSFDKIENEKQTNKIKTLASDLILMEFTTAAEFKTNQFIYKTKNHYIKDYYNRFFSSPEKMVQNGCLQWFENAGVFHNISTKSQISFSDLVLKGKILEIYCDRTDSTEPFAIIKIKFNLIEYNKKDKTILEKDFYSKVKLSNFSAENLVAAWSRCLKNIFQNLESEMIDNL